MKTYLGIHLTSESVLEASVRRRCKGPSRGPPRAKFKIAQRTKTHPENIKFISTRGVSVAFSKKINKSNLTSTENK